MPRDLELTVHLRVDDEDDDRETVAVGLRSAIDELSDTFEVRRVSVDGRARSDLSPSCC